MKIVKTKVNKAAAPPPPPPPPIVIMQEKPRRDMRNLLIVALLLGLLVSLTRCSSLPPDLASLQQENAMLRAQLEECERDAAECLDHLTECESINE